MIRLLLPLAALVSAFGPAIARDRLDVAGTIALTADAAAAPVMGPDGRPLFIGTSHGTNQSAGKTEFMSGAEVASADTASLVDGNGAHHGYITMSKGGDRVVFKWSGQVTTVMGPDKKPSSTFKGIWTALSGGGKYAKASGGGSYTGRFTSSTASVIEWTGSLNP